MYYNKVVLVGTVGKEPEFIDQNHNRAIFPLEQRKAWSNRKTGRRHEEVLYHRIEISGAVLKSALPILFKDTAVLVEGELVSKEIRTGGEGVMNKYMFISEVAAALIKKMRRSL